MLNAMMQKRREISILIWHGLRGCGWKLGRGEKEGEKGGGRQERKEEGRKEEYLRMRAHTQMGLNSKLISAYL